MCKIRSALYIKTECNKKKKKKVLVIILEKARQPLKGATTTSCEPWIIHQNPINRNLSFLTN